MADDTLDVRLTVEDITSMDPMMVLSMYNKVRQSRSEMAQRVVDLNDELQGMRNKLNHEQVRLSQALAREARQQRSLAAVGEKMIQLGVLDALSLNVERD